MTLARLYLWSYLLCSSTLLHVDVFAANFTTSRLLRSTRTETEAIANLLPRDRSHTKGDEDSAKTSNRTDFWTLEKQTAADFTLVVQTSEDRTWLIPHSCERWRGPLSIIVYIPSEKPSDEELREREQTIASECAHGSPFQLPEDGIENRKKVAPRIGGISVQVVRKSSKSEEYPVNHLRNLGISAVKTSHFLVIDVDFIPSTELYDMLVHLGRTEPETFRIANQALVIPAFRIASVSSWCKYVAPPKKSGEQPKCAINFAVLTPRTFHELLVCVTHNLCRPFDWVHNPFGHSTTDYPIMLSQHENHIRPIKCFDSNKYEPYVVLSKEGGRVPKYDEAFTGYGKNKIELIMWMRAQGFSFSVLPRVFLVHLPHPRSKAKRLWDGHKRSENSKILSSAVETLHDPKEREKISGTTEITHLCKKSQRALGRHKDVWVESLARAKEQLLYHISQLGLLVDAMKKQELQWLDAHNNGDGSADSSRKGMEAMTELRLMRRYHDLVDSSAVKEAQGPHPFLPKTKTHQQPPCNDRGACY